MRFQFLELMIKVVANYGAVAKAVEAGTFVHGPRYWKDVANIKPGIALRQFQRLTGEAGLVKQIAKHMKQRDYYAHYALMEGYIYALHKERVAKAIAKAKAVDSKAHALSREVIRVQLRMRKELGIDKL